MRVGVDIDDILCDFVVPLNSFVASLGIYRTVYDYTDGDFGRIWDLDKIQTNKILENFIFNEHQPLPLKYSQEVLSRLKSKGFKFHAITARDHKLKTKTQSWLDLHYPGVFSDIHICNYHGEGDRIEK